MTPPEGPRPTVTPTPPLRLALVAAVGALVAALARVMVERGGGTAPSPAGAAVWIFLLGVATTLFAWTARRRIQQRRERVEPAEATRWLAIGKTGAFVGALFTGGFLAYALMGWARMDTAAGGPRFWLSVAAAVAAAFWMGAGIALERACRIPPGPDDPAARPGA